GEIVGVAMQVGDARRDLDAGDIDPGPTPDPVASVYDRGVAGRGRTQVGAPGVARRARRRRQLQTNGVGAGEPTEVRAEAAWRTGNEERHRCGALRWTG